MLNENRKLKVAQKIFDKLTKARHLLNPQKGEKVYDKEGYKVEVKNIFKRHERVVRDFMKAFGNLDKDSILKCLDENVVWHVAPSFEMGDIVGKENIIGLMFSTTSEFYRLETLNFDIHFIVTNETHGAMQVTMTCQTNAGVDYSNFYALTFRFENGLIAECWEHMDTVNFHNQVLGKS